LGQTAFTACATAIAPLQLGGVAGWQCALILISALSALIGLLVLLLVTDTAQATYSRGPQFPFWGDDETLEMVVKQVAWCLYSILY